MTQTICDNMYHSCFDTSSGLGEEEIQMDEQVNMNGYFYMARKLYYVDCPIAKLIFIYNFYGLFLWH